MTGIILSPKDIFEQDFKRTMRGYDTKEVDVFLDDVIKDYETFTSQIEALKKEIEALKADKKELDTPSATPVYQASQSIYGTPVFNPSDVVKPSGAVTNFDILKRISRLEKEVFGKQIVE